MDVSMHPIKTVIAIALLYLTTSYLTSAANDFDDLPEVQALQKGMARM